ncbi:phage tail protein [Pseudomonas sp. PDM13]|uniref:phage tail protein n=1 Tax=Pseudomonas sp. PDM13 TaxID=2769255 RepID=UPI0021E0EDBB|nr:phage tail protein [Pseudomonas sp. PDM13]MCU9949859.1 phage tail protein [Pseudomonas sp. PDM13]
MAALETFTWRVQRGDDGQEEGTVRSAQFGDGYRQTSGDGLNSVNQTWAVTCTEPKAAAAQMRSFMRRHLGRSFAWTNPWGETGLYQSSSWSFRFVGGGFVVFTARFEEAFHP